MNSQFSIVIPVSLRDVRLLEHTIPSWLALGPAELILALDKPAPHLLLASIERVRRRDRRADIIRVIEVARSYEWRFHQANVRRQGFESAANDVILTGDIDLLVNPNLLKLVRFVGKDNIGLASCMRIRAPYGFVQLLRDYSYLFLSAIRHPPFSGVYAMWRPFWRATEDRAIRYLKNPARERYSLAGPGVLGEDTYLYLCMRKKYRCVYVNRLGAVSLAREVEDLPMEQYAWGEYMAGTGGTAIHALAMSAAFAYPFYYAGFRHQRDHPRKFLDPFASGVREGELV